MNEMNETNEQMRYEQMSKWVKNEGMKE